MKALWTLSLLLCAHGYAGAEPANPSNVLGEKGFKHKTGGVKSQQGTVDALGIGLKDPLDEKTRAELRRLSSADSTSPALKKLIDEALQVPEGIAQTGEAAAEISYQRPPGQDNPGMRTGIVPAGRSSHRRTSPAPEPAKPIQEKVPLDLNRAMRDSPGVAPLLHANPANPAELSNPLRALEFRKQTEERKASFMREGDQTPRPLRSAKAIAKTPDPVVRPIPAQEPDLLGIAKGLLKKGELEKAEAATLLAIRLRPADPRALILLTQILFEQKRFQEARDMASRTALLAPHDPRVFLLRAAAYERLGNRNAMLADLGFAATLDKRYQRQLKSVQLGKSLFADSSEGIWNLVEEHPLRARRTADRRGSSFVLLALGTLLGIAGAGTLLLLRRKKQAGRADPPSGRMDSQEGRAVISSPPLPPLKLNRNMVIVDKYTLLNFLRFDGTVELWKAHDRTLGRDVLLKRLYAGNKAHGTQERLRRLDEARTAAKLSHPNITDLFEILDIASGLYIVYEYSSGKTVARILEEKGALPPGQVRNILIPVCRALEHAHELNIPHGGLSPHRIVIAKNGYIKIEDFVLARTTGEGAEPYAAPEAKRGEPTPVSDIYSLGLCCYEMLTGELPHTRAREPDLRVNTLLERTLDLDYRTRMRRPKDFLRLLSRLPESLEELPQDPGGDDDQSGSETEAIA